MCDRAGDAVAVRLFARARELADAPEVRISLPTGATVAELRKRLATQHPALAGLVDRSAIAVDNELADDTVPIPPGAEIALLPPVSGG